MNLTEIHASHPIPVRQAGPLPSASSIEVVAFRDLPSCRSLPCSGGQRLSPHRHTCVAGRSYKMPALLSDSGHSVFAYAKSYRGPSPGRYEPEQVTPVRSVVILQRDDRGAGDESFRARSGGNPWCGNIRWNPFQRSCRPDTVFFPHSTCCAFQAKSKSRSEFSSSVDA